MKARRDAQRPHGSFDLDGDGVVSQEDFYASTKWDTQKDGQLTNSERLEAIRESSTRLASQLTKREIGGNATASSLMRSLRGPPQLDDGLRALQMQQSAMMVRKL